VEGGKRSRTDVIVEFQFALEGPATFNAAFDDKSYEGFCAGYICKVTFSMEQILL
jgi:hypothetical protein